MNRDGVGNRHGRNTPIDAPPSPALAGGAFPFNRDLSDRVEPLYATWGSGPAPKGVQWGHGESPNKRRRTGASEQSCRRRSDVLRRSFSRSGVPARSRLRSGQRRCRGTEPDDGRQSLERKPV